MNAWIWILIAIVAVLLIAYFVWKSVQQRRLKGRYGREYERTVAESGSKRQATSELKEREKRREKLDVRPLEPAARDRYLHSWRETQARFVDIPTDSVKEADALIQQVMRERGYPVDDFDQRAADLSVDHPRVVEDYRAAHRVTVASNKGDATTEDLRQAMVHYRSLFEQLLHDEQSGRAQRG
jgi:hypothetical protein